VEFDKLAKGFILKLLISIQILYNSMLEYAMLSTYSLKPS
jgi:hypothetical protein